MDWDEVLEEIHRNREEGNIVTFKEVTDSCPDCNRQLIHQEGIIICHHCGYQSAPC